MYRHKHDKDGSCSVMGGTAEQLFSKAIEDFGASATATGFKDQIRHIDFFVSIEGAVDVKARKRLSRAGAIQDEFVWVELVGNGGKKGWVYGACTHLAFERERDFVVVPRANLAALCEELVEDIIVHRVGEAHLHRYQRKGKKDQCTLIPMRTIIKNTPCILMKKQS